MSDEMKQALEAALARANESAFAAEVANIELNQIFNNATDGMWILTLDGRVQRVNDTLVKTLGRSREEMLGRPCSDIFPGEICEGKQCPIEEIKRDSRRRIPRVVREVYLPIGGDLVPHLLTATPFFGVDGDLVGIVGNYRDISEQKAAEVALREANEQLRRLASVDALTQLPNRRRLDECLDLEWRRMIRERRPLSFIICDVDHFKKFNDRYGHQAGDYCLRAVAEAIRGRVRRPADMAARYGGEEFAVILPSNGLDGALFVADTIREAVLKLRIPHADSETCSWVSLSLGVATIMPREGIDIGRLVQAADQALYQAKNGGRNQVAVMDVDA